MSKLGIRLVAAAAKRQFLLLVVQKLKGKCRKGKEANHLERGESIKMLTA